MKVSALHESNGVVVVLRNNKTGESIHFNFHKGLKALPLQVTIGDHRLEAQVHLKPSTTDSPHDDMDVEFSLRVPDLVVAEARPVPVPDVERIEPADVIPEEAAKPAREYVEPQLIMEEPKMEEVLVEEKPTERKKRR